MNPDEGSIDDEIHAVRWSPDGNYLAVGGIIGDTTGNDLFIYKFNRSTEKLTEVDSVNPDVGSTDDEVDTLAWSPDGKYLAVGGIFLDTTNNPLFIYRFNRTTEKLIEVDSVNPDNGMGGQVFTVNWSADSNYLIVGGSFTGITGNDLFMYKFNKFTETLIEVDSINPDGGSSADLVFTAEWSPDGGYIAAGGIVNGTTGNDLFMVTGFTFPMNNVITHNTVYCDAGSSTPGGIGISGSSITSEIIGNVAYANPMNPAIIGSNYQFVCNVFNPLFGDEPMALQNIALNSKTPIPSRFDIPTALNRLEVLAESLVDNLL